MIALFIFTILSTILVGALHSVMTAVAGTEKSRARMHALQIAFLMMNRDLLQTVNRESLNENGNVESAFVGEEKQFTFTHGGGAGGVTATPNLQRTIYLLQGNCLARRTLPVLDGGTVSQKKARCLIQQVKRVQFAYLDQNNHFQSAWPQNADQFPIPRAVKMTLTLTHLGKMNLIYVIPLQINTNHAAKASSLP